MKRVFVAALLFTSCLTPAFAANVTLTSSVGEVTVYPRGAQVTRTATGNVPAGDNVIIISDLPGNMVKNSVRVEGSSAQSLEIGSVDVRQTYVSLGDNLDERVKIERQIEALKDRISVLNQAINNANTQRNMLQALASKAILPRPREQGGSIAISASELNELLSLTGSQLAALSATTEKARIDKRDLSRQITDLQHKLNQGAPKQRLVITVAINLTAAAAGDASFRIRYNVSNAGWAPIYDARLTLGEKGQNNFVKLVRRANVRQSTTDKWDNIKLTLSTARPSAATKAPVLSPYVLSRREIGFARKEKRKRTMLSSDQAEPVVELQAIGAAAPKPVRRQDVAVVFSGFLAEYKIPGQVSVSNVGAEKNVIIGERSFAAEIAANTTPKRDTAAYLTAKFTLKGNAPYFPGTVLLSRDGVFLGRGRLPLLNPDEEHKLSFGRDDFIKVKRTKVTEKAGESGFVSRTKEETRKFVTTVENLHDFPMNVTVNDHIPYGTHEDIKVQMTAGSTKPTKTNVGKKRGVLAWEKTLKAKEKYTINFGYKVSWPRDMRITPVR